MRGPTAEKTSLASGVVWGFNYDAAGNVIAEARTGGGNFTYDAAGQMETFSISGFLQSSYKYDAMGRQAIRTLTSPAPVTIQSVFDSKGRRIAEYIETSGALICKHVWNGWDSIAVIEDGVISYVRADHIGRPVFATNASGVRVWSAIPGPRKRARAFGGRQSTGLFSDPPRPFGGVHTSTGGVRTARLPGLWFQSESGLHQNWMRDDDPVTGRYIQPDRLGLIDGPGVYGYALQSPMKWTDPTGEKVGGGMSRAGTLGVAGFCAAVDGPIPIGDLVALGILGYLALDYMMSPATPQASVCQTCPTNCPPCSPYPVGTVGFQGPEIGVRGRDAGITHYHIYEVQQIPSTCECIWRDATKRIAGGHHSYVPIGSVNLNGNGRPPSYP